MLIKSRSDVQCISVLRQGNVICDVLISGPPPGQCEVFICTELLSNPLDQIALQGVVRDRDGTLTTIFLQWQINLELTKDQALNRLKTMQSSLNLSYSSLKVITNMGGAMQGEGRGGIRG